MYSYFSHRSAGSRAVMYVSRLCRSAGVIVAVCAIAMFGTCKRSQAATVDAWNVHSGGSWNIGANWSTGNKPTIAEDATIGPIATSATSPASIARVHR